MTTKTEALLQAAKPFARAADIADFYVDEVIPQAVQFPVAGTKIDHDGPSPLELTPDDFRKLRDAVEALSRPSPAGDDVERVARAIFAQRHPNGKPDRPVHYNSEGTVFRCAWQHYEEHARAALAAAPGRVVPEGRVAVLENILRLIAQRARIGRQLAEDGEHQSAATRFTGIASLVADALSTAPPPAEELAPAKEQSAWTRRPGETEEQHQSRCRHYEFMAFDPDNPDIPLD